MIIILKLSKQLMTSRKTKQRTGKSDTAKFVFTKI